MGFPGSFFGGGGQLHWSIGIQEHVQRGFALQSMLWANEKNVAPTLLQRGKYTVHYRIALL